jgi:hypothetical protein
MRTSQRSIISMPPPTVGRAPPRASRRGARSTAPHVALEAHRARDDRRRRAAELAQVAAGRERAARAAQHEHAHVRIVVDGAERGEEVVAHRDVVRVQRLGRSSVTIATAPRFSKRIVAYGLTRAMRSVRRSS